MADEQAGPVEQVAVTGRPADVAPENSTFASRASAGETEEKAVESAENKSVSSKRTRRKS